MTHISKEPVVKMFEEMLRQMSVHFTVSQVVHVVIFVHSSKGVGFLLAMENGEYWWVTNISPTNSDGVFVLYKYQAPVPTVEQLIGAPLVDAANWGINPVVLNDYLEAVGGSETLFLPKKDSHDGEIDN